MSKKSSKRAEWFSLLEPANPPSPQPSPPAKPGGEGARGDDSRLGEIVEFWSGGEPALTPGRAVIVGFPQDEGVRRNNGRTGAADAPDAIRRFLYRLTPWDGEHQVDLSDLPPLDLGNVRIAGTLEVTQHAVGKVVGAILSAGAVPIVLGGGHETAFGHYLGYVAARKPVGIINIDAHLDVRPCIDGLGTSGTPFRQMMQHPTSPLPGERYVCLGVQPHSVSREHERYTAEKGCTIRWRSQVESSLEDEFLRHVRRFADASCGVYVSVDADVVQAADVPGVSAPNSFGLFGRQLLELARLAGQSRSVASFDLVEINPRFDRDDQSSRWAALAIWNLLTGLATREKKSKVIRRGERKERREKQRG